MVVLIWRDSGVEGLVSMEYQDFEEWGKLEEVGRVGLQEVTGGGVHLPVCLSLHSLVTMS